MCRVPSTRARLFPALAHSRRKWRDMVLGQYKHQQHTKQIAFNTSPNTGVRLWTALFSSAPSSCCQQHKGITEWKMRCCHQNRLYLHSHEVQRDQTPVTEHKVVCSGPRQQCPQPKAHLLQHWEPLACPGTFSRVPRTRGCRAESILLLFGPRLLPVNSLPCLRCSLKPP